MTLPPPDDANPPEPPRADPTAPPPPGSTPAGPPAPPAWQPPSPLSFGPPEPPPGPLVSPAISAYQPYSATPPSEEPPTDSMPAEPVTSPPAPSAPVYGPPSPPAPAGYAPVQYHGAYAPYVLAGYSDKSKVTAGLLQLLLGALLGLGGIGRLYAGQTSLGGVQLGLSVFAWIGGICTGGLLWLLLCPLWVWFVVDGIVILAGNPVDGQGRPLRP